MTEPLFEATVLPSRALSWEGRLYVSGETVLLPLDEANALERAGVVEVAAQSVKSSTRKRSS
jgi:hypothetical protein